MRDNTHWVGTWTTAPAPAEGAAFSNQTLRMIAARQHRRRTAAGAPVERLWHSPAGRRRGARRPARTGPAHRAGLRPTADLRRRRPGDHRRRRAGRQRSGRARVRAAGGPRGQRASAGRPAGELRDHRPLCAADQLHLAAGRFRRRGASCRSAASPTTGTSSAASTCVAPPETGGIVALGDSLTDANISTHRRAIRWPDQLARRLVARRRPADGGDEPGARRQPHPARHPRRQRPAPLRPRRAGAARRHPRRSSCWAPTTCATARQARGRGHRRADDRRAEAARRARPARAASRSSAAR